MGGNKSLTVLNMVISYFLGVTLNQVFSKYNFFSQPSEPHVADPGAPEERGKNLKSCGVGGSFPLVGLN